MNILVVVDMQKDFITGALGNSQCEACVPEVVKAINDPKYDRIYVTLDTHTEDYLNTQEGAKLPVVHCVKGSDGWALDDNICAALKANPLNDGRVKMFEKETFGSKELGEEFRQYADMADVNVDMVGVCTGICVISNAFIIKANAPEAAVAVIEKACACVTPDTHRTAIDAMKLCQIEIK